ncbi:hypothetical protein [Methylobacterium sp. ID0610]|uniref:hypothetical protein n=1 Tax=Methylobacterium carpenticola TaxID=3344827 RepID=UPI0036CAB642
MIRSVLSAAIVAGVAIVSLAGSAEARGFGGGGFRGGGFHGGGFHGGGFHGGGFHRGGFHGGFHHHGHHRFVRFGGYPDWCGYGWGHPRFCYYP